MIGQIQITQLKDYEQVKYKLGINKKRILEFANSHCVSMVERGGGVIDLRWRKLSEDMIVIELLIDVREAMGANAVNTLAETTSPFIH